jgi:large exoprotein involved in heme utilization and adhesion
LGLPACAIKPIFTAQQTFGKAYNLKIGVALTSEQMALLTGDIVWLVRQS